MSETAKEREQRWLRERADAEDKCESVAVGGGMSDQPTPKPPWERKAKTLLEHVIALAWAEYYRTPAADAWSELCSLRTRLAALERVMKAAASLVMNNYRGPEDYDQLYAAIDAAKWKQ